jgi:hypothetical protein
MQTLLTRTSLATSALFVLLLLSGHSAAAATESGLRVVFDTTRVEENPAAEAGPKSTVEKQTLTARMTPTMLALRSDDSERIFDFVARRVVVLDHAKRSSHEFSLYAEPGFRELELVNRMALSRGFAAIMGEKYDLVDAEAELGMRGDPPAKLKMTEMRRGEERVFVINKREVVTFVPAADEVPTGLAKGVDRLYLFEAQLHPQVRAALTAQVSLPARLTYGFRLLGSQTQVTWQLREAVVEEMDLTAAAAQYPIGPVQPEPILEVAWRVRSGQAGAPPTPADYEARAEKLLAEGRAFESFLVAMESGFATDVMPEGLMRRARAAAASDPRMHAYSRAAEIELAHGDANESLKLLEPLDAAALEGGPAIYVQRSNQHVRLRDGTRGIEEFAKALAVNPFIVGAWLDAGRLYYNSFAMPMAWSCWDAARSIAPGSALFRDVDEMEAALRRKHPEFF